MTKLAWLPGARDPKTGELKPVSRKFVVTGAFRSGWQEIDAHLCYARRNDMIEFLETSTDFTEMCVVLKNPLEAENVKKKLQKKLNPSFFNYFSVERWEERRQTFISAIELERNVMAIILFFYSIACVGYDCYHFGIAGK